MFGKNQLSKEAQLKALAEMKAELEAVKAAVEDFDAQLGDTGPSDIDFGGMDESGPSEDIDFGGGEGEEGKEKEPVIKTPEDAKKALEEAKKDISNVVENLDGLVGQTEEEEKIATFKRPNEKYASTIASLASNADKAITDAKGALKHWAFLLKLKKKASKTPINDNRLKSALDTVKEAKSLVSEVEGLFKAGTSVPPTGAKFTGDKWPNGKDPKTVEDHHWEAGASKFHKDKKFEDARPNPAVDERLTTVEYPRDDSPFVNASVHVVDGENKEASYWDIADTKSGKRMLVTFASLPDEIGPKDEKTFKMFITPRYGRLIASNIAQHGFDSIKEQLDGKLAKFVPTSLAKVAADSKTNVRKYYTDAYGDAEFSKRMVAGQDKENMDIAYKPKDDKVKEADTNVKDGEGTLSTQKVDPQLIRAKAAKAVELAQFAASRGIIPFTKQAVRKTAQEYMKYTDEQFKFAEATYGKLPLVNEAALKSAHIPDAESGIVGNPLEGVRDQGASASTEDLDSGVASDAKVSSKKASFVPQVTVDNQLNKKSPFKSRMVDGLQKKGALSDVRKPHYKTS